MSTELKTQPKVSPLAGKPAPKDLLVDLAQLETRLLRAPPRRRRSQATRQLRHQRPSRHVAARHVHRSAHPRHHAGDLRVPQARRASTARCSWARTRTRSRRRRSARRWKFWRPTASRRHPARRRLHADAGHLARDPHLQPRPQEHLADGIVITPSHNPPEDGGFKYNPPNGGPADTDVTNWIQDRANELLRGNNDGVKRMPYRAAIKAPTTHASTISSCPTSTT